MELKKPGTYKRNSKWFENAWSKMEILGKNADHSATRYEIEHEHAVFLRDLRAQMIHEGVIKLAQLDRLHEIFARYEHQDK